MFSTANLLFTACYASLLIQPQAGHCNSSAAAVVANADILHRHGRISYSRSTLLSIRRKADCRAGRNSYLDVINDLGLLHYRGCRGGRNKQRPITVHISPPLSLTHNINKYSCLPQVNKHSSLIKISCGAFSDVQPFTHPRTLCTRTSLTPPSLYVLNAQSLAKPHALQQLEADLLSYSIDVAAITETL